MKLQIASYELAKLAQEKGFNWITRHYYDREDQTLSEFMYFEFDQWDYNNEFESKNQDFNDFEDWCSSSKPDCAAPTLDLLCKWFRDVHDLNIEIGWWNSGTWSYDIGKPTQSKPERAFSQEGFFNTYELALEEALFKAFELI